MTLPRQVLPGQSYMVTRRCTQRQLLMRPDEETTQNFEYCLAVAANRFGIELLFTIAMSNHHHTGIFDRDGRYPEFLEYFHKLFAKCQNTLRGRWENFWASEQTSVVRLEAGEDVLDKLVYAVTNPAKDHLVEYAKDWPGASSLSANLTGSEKHVARPKCFFRENGPMPEMVLLKFHRPSEFRDLSNASWSKLLNQKVRAREEKAATERREAQRKVPSRRALVGQDWRSIPRTKEPRRGLRPRVAAKNGWRRIEALKRNTNFVEAYRAARQLLKDGYNYVMFPEGTYWMARFMKIVCETQPISCAL